MAVETTVRERPILMHGRSIRNILAGNKSQTRRIIKGGRALCYLDTVTGLRDIPLSMCPYGKPGDRLWVRERFSYEETPPKNQYAIYADGTGKSMLGTQSDGWKMDGRKFKPSIFMPRWASRVTLEIVGIRVERVQDISEEDCHAEGILQGNSMPRDEFAKLWDDTNGKGAWDLNQWCWCIDFKRIV